MVNDQSRTRSPPSPSPRGRQEYNMIDEVVAVAFVVLEAAQEEEKDKRSDRARSEEDRKKNTELKETVEKLENKNKQLERELTEVNGEIKRFKSMLSARCVIEWFEKFHLHMEETMDKTSYEETMDKTKSQANGTTFAPRQTSRELPSAAFPISMPTI
ncbi:unnamed protein product, partial [Mesorhabditis belari]|uniref:Uncharacterized protein n=1 Tax=Mesorhabditis belari TaxID=2138241 RepID=A0AAF3F7K9_9BILA